MIARAVTPILSVSSFSESVARFEKLGWTKRFQWAELPTFGAVGSGECETYLCQGAQGGRGNCGVISTFGEGGSETTDRGVSMSIRVEGADAVHRHRLEQGLDVAFPPTDTPWCVREKQLRHPEGHVFRVSRGIAEEKQAG